MLTLVFTWRVLRSPPLVLFPVGCVPPPQDPSKEFQHFVASLLRDSARPLVLTFCGPHRDGPRLATAAILRHFAGHLEPGSLPHHLQAKVLDAIQAAAAAVASASSAAAGSEGSSGGSGEGNGGLAPLEGVLRAVGVAVGQSLVFVRPEASALLDEALSARLAAAAAALQLQGVRPWLRRLKRRGALSLQRLFRGTRGRRWAAELGEASRRRGARVVVERCLRRAAWLRKRRAAVRLQALGRGTAARAAQATRARAATALQCLARRVRAVQRRRARKDEVLEVAGLQAQVKALRATVDKLAGPHGAKHELRQVKSRRLGASHENVRRECATRFVWEERERTSAVAGEWNWACRMSCLPRPHHIVLCGTP